MLVFTNSIVSNPWSWSPMPSPLSWDATAAIVLFSLSNIFPSTVQVSIDNSCLDFKKGAAWNLRQSYFYTLIFVLNIVGKLAAYGAGTMPAKLTRIEWAESREMTRPAVSHTVSAVRGCTAAGSLVRAQCAPREKCRVLPCTRPHGKLSLFWVH